MARIVGGDWLWHWVSLDATCVLAGVQLSPQIGLESSRRD
jgi:hypothetical protein